MRIKAEVKRMFVFNDLAAATISDFSFESFSIETLALLELILEIDWENKEVFTILTILNSFLETELSGQTEFELAPENQACPFGLVLYSEFLNWFAKSFGNLAASKFFSGE